MMLLISNCLLCSILFSALVKMFDLLSYVDKCFELIYFRLCANWI